MFGGDKLFLVEEVGVSHAKYNQKKNELTVQFWTWRSVHDDLVVGAGGK